MARWVSKLAIWVDASSEPLKKFAGAARGAASALRSISHALDFSNLAATKSFQLNKALTETAAQMGGSASQLSDQVISLSNATGLSTEKTSALVQALASAGQEIGKIDPRLAELTGRYGMSAQGAAQLVAATRNLGTTITSLTDDVASWQVQFKMPGMLQQLPEVLDYSRKSMAEFGTAITGDTKTILENTMKTGAVYARVFGVDMPQAIQMAQQNQSKFASSLSNSRRVFLGLSKDFDALTTSLMETGQYGFQEIQDMLKNGQKDPVAFAKNIQEMETRMRAAGEAGKFMADRLHEQMLMNAPEAVKELLTTEGALTEALKKRAEAQRIANTDVGKGTGAFDNMTASLKDTAGTAIETFKNLLSLGKTIIGLAFADDVNHMFQGLGETLKGLNVRIKTFAENVTKSKTFQTLRPIIHAVGKALIVIGTAAGAAASGLASIFTVSGGFSRVLGFFGKGTGLFKTFAEAVDGLGERFVGLFSGGGRVTRIVTFIPRLIGKALGPITGVVGKLGSFLLGGLAKIGDKIAKFFLVPFQMIKAVFVALNDIGKAFADPDLTPMQKMMKIVRGAFVGLANFVDSMLLGIPSFIMKTFFPSMGKSLEGGVKKLFRRFERWIAGDGGDAMSRGWAKVKDVFARALNATRQWFIGNLNTWHKKMSGFGRNIGRALGEIAKMVGRGVRAMFSVKFWSDAWDDIVGWFSSSGAESASGAFGDIFATILDGVIAFGESFSDELLHAFGGSLDEAVGLFQDYGDDIAKFMDHLVTGITDFFKHPIDMGIKLYTDFVFKIEDTFADLLDFMGGIWEKIRGVVATAVGGLIDKTLGPLVKIMAKVGLVSQETADSVASIGSKVQQSIAQSNPAEAMRKSIAEQQANVRQYLSQNSELEKSKQELEKRDADRDQASLKRQQAIAAKVSADNKKRQDETEKLKAAKALLATSKQAGESQLSAIVASLSTQLEAAKKDPSRKGDLAKIQKKLDKAQGYLEKVQDASKPETINKILQKAGKLVPKAAEKPAPTPALMPEKVEQGPAPTQAALGAGSMKPSTPPAPAPTPAAPQSVTVKNVLEFRGELGKMVEKKQAEAMVSAGGGIGGRP